MVYCKREHVSWQLHTHNPDAFGAAPCLLPCLSIFQNTCPSLAKQGTGDEVASSTLQLIESWPPRIAQTDDPLIVLLARTITDLALLAKELSLLDTHEPSRRAGAAVSTCYSSQNTSRADGGKVPDFVVPGMLCGHCSVFHELERKHNIFKA